MIYTLTGGNIANKHKMPFDDYSYSSYSLDEDDGYYIEDSDYDESYTENIIYEPEEESTTKFNIVLCELYSSSFHGEPIDKNTIYNYIVINRFKELNILLINNIANNAMGFYSYIVNKDSKLIYNNIFKNYKNIIMKQDYIKPEIAQCIYLSGGELIAIIKTFWIKLIQRTWKKIYKQKKEIIEKRKSLQSIMSREINGKCKITPTTIPSLKGMLYYLAQ